MDDELKSPEARRNAIEAIARDLDGRDDHLSRSVARLARIIAAEMDSNITPDWP